MTLTGIDNAVNRRMFASSTGASRDQGRRQQMTKPPEPQQVARSVGHMEVIRLREALFEIVMRTSSYQDQWDEWPLVAGVNDVARRALAK